MEHLRKIYIFIIVLGVLIIGLIVFSIIPLFEKIQKGSEDFIKEREKLVLIFQKKEEAKKLDVIYRNHQSDFNKIDDLFVNSENPIEFIEFLEKTAADLTIQLEISSMSEKIKEDVWPSFSLQLLISDSFEKFLKFLKKLENAPYLIEFFDFNVKKIPNSDNIEGVLLIKIFGQQTK